MRQEIRFCVAGDGIRLAYAKAGHGPPLVKVGNWMTHLDHDLGSPIWRPFLDGWTRHHTLYRYDQRGCGLSDRYVADFSFERLVADLEKMVDTAGLERFNLLGTSQGGSVAIAYAARHPERITRLVICGGYARGQLKRPGDQHLDAVDVELRLLRLSWGMENPAYRQVFTTFLIPEGTPEQFAWFNELQRISTSRENAVSLQQTFNVVDVQAAAAHIGVPTLVVHAKHDAAVPFEEGRFTATLIPGARFVSLESKNHILLEGESAWPNFWQEFYAFLGIEATSIATGAQPAGTSSAMILPELSHRERDILRLLAGGDRNADIARKLSLSEKTVRNYVSNIYSKLQMHSRGEAIVFARKSGLVSDKP